MAQVEEAWGPAPAVRSTKKRRGRTKLLVAGAAFLAVIGILMFNALQNTGAYYLTIAEAYEGKAGSHQIRITGNVVADSIDWQSKTLTAHFTITDGAETLPVVYTGVLPDTFVPEAEVIVEGYYVAGQPFEAKKIYTKCPSKYEAAEAADR